MILDFNELPDGHVLLADLAIVGAGAAGITLAREFARTGHRVVLLESGGLELEGPVQELYEGEVVGTTYPALEMARARYLRGSTNMWTGWCKPLDPVDFQPRPWLGLTGWPVTRDELQPFYVRAQEVVEAGSYEYDARLWGEAAARFDAFDLRHLELSFWQKSPPTRFGERYREDLRRAENVTVLLHGNVANVQADPSGAWVEELHLRGLEGKHARVQARSYVLACGGIENARLLLASNSVVPAGLGNDRDHVGRCFSDHPYWVVGRIFPTDAYALLDRYGRRTDDGRLTRLGWSMSRAAQERLGASNCIAVLGTEVDQDSGSHAASELWRDIRRGVVPDRLSERVLAVLGDIGEVAESVWRKKILGSYVNKPVSEVRLAVVLDQVPNPASRVTLSTQRDALGMPRVRLDWRLSAADERSMEVLALTVAAELARLDLGRVQLHEAVAPASGWARAGNLIGYDVAPDAPEMKISWHHIGTTRMAATPEDGVVDGDCRVHGVQNLFVAGSSVFPTAGNANPTLTIVALALRLADHLKTDGLPDVAGLPLRQG
jgi:choline dehydrogenase-like flavoprotein